MPEVTNNTPTGNGKSDGTAAGRAGHTPGRWFATEPDDNPSAIKAEQDGRWVYVADVLDERDRPLIAAAPDLLAALRTVMAEFFPHPQEDEYPELANARDAIAKAEGTPA